MLPQVDALGRIYVISGGVPAYWNRGIAYDVQGRMCTTVATAAEDVWVGGWRLNNLGQVIVSSLAGSPFYNGGLPFNVNGAMARQNDQTPGMNDPYVAGIRVGSLGGVYFTSAVPPNSFTGFDNGFSNGFGAS